MKLQAKNDDNDVSSMPQDAQMQNISAELRQFCEAHSLRHHISPSAMLSLLQEEDYDILIWLYHCMFYHYIIFLH